MTTAQLQHVLPRFADANARLASAAAAAAACHLMPALPITPPNTEADADPRTEGVLKIATNVLCTEATALSSLATLYETDPGARRSFANAVHAIAASQALGGKTVVIGVGKSGKVGEKLVASMNSLGLFTVFLNPIEALHGDLGIVKPNDVLLFLTYSGNTSELKQLLPHLPCDLPVVVVTKHRTLQDVPLTQDRQGTTILLPAPIPQSEMASFGISAPTTSTTVAMALGDALVLAVGAVMHHKPGATPLDVFLKNHPGGAIGSSAKADTIGYLATRLEDMPLVSAAGAPETGLHSPAVSDTSSESDVDVDVSGGADWHMSSSSSSSSSSSPSSSPLSSSPGACDPVVTVLDCLRVAAATAKKWVRTREGVVPPRRLLKCNAHAPALQLAVRPGELLKFAAERPTLAVRCELEALAFQHKIAEDTVVAVTEDGEIVGVVEVGDLIARE